MKAELRLFASFMALELLDAYALCHGYALKYTIPLFILLFFATQVVGCMTSETILMSVHTKKVVVEPAIITESKTVEVVKTTKPKEMNIPEVLSYKDLLSTTKKEEFS